MSVLIVTSLGDLVVDLFHDQCPMTCKNFLKLCKMKYYNGCLFHTVQKDFTAQTGDPTGVGAGGDSLYKFVYGDQARFFSDEIHHDLKHKNTGTVAMASAGENLNASQFYITLRDNLDYLDGKHTVFGEVAEGLETLSRINEAYVDEKNRPYKNIRIKHTYILDDNFDDPPQLAELIPDASPEGKPKDEALDDVRLEDDWIPLDEYLRPEELEEVFREKDARASAVVLESIGDIPDADIKPPDNVLFVCKLNPLTEDEDLNIIFSRFGTVIEAEIIRDYKTGNSLCYAFIEFETNEACVRAYMKMNNALIDDRRIKVDFSQSVSKQWSQYRQKRNQTGGNCFKCGAADHNAKDCTGNGASKQQPQKYTLKDDNSQRGGECSRYDMVFDGDTPESLRQEKKLPNDQLGRERRHGTTSDDRYERAQRGDKSRPEEEDDDKHPERKASRYPDEQSGEREHRRSKEKGSNRKNNYQSRGERRESDRDRDYRKRNGDDYQSRGERRESDRDRDYRKRNGDGEHDGKRHRRDLEDGRDDHKRRQGDGEKRGSQDRRVRISASKE